MNELELRKRNLAVINRATKLSTFLIARVVRSDSDLFGKPDGTVNNPEFSKLVEYMILNKIEQKSQDKIGRANTEIL